MYIGNANGWRNVLFVQSFRRGEKLSKEKDTVVKEGEYNKANPMYVNVNIRMPGEWRRELYTEARNLGLSLSAYIRIIIRARQRVSITAKDFEK